MMGYLFNSLVIHIYGRHQAERQGPLNLLFKIFTGDAHCHQGYQGPWTS